MEQMSGSILLPGRLILLTALFLLAVRPVAAFNLSWLAKYYGRDWRADSLAAADAITGTERPAAAETAVSIPHRG